MTAAEQIRETLNSFDNAGESRNGEHMESTGVLEIVGSSPLPHPCCGEVYGHTPDCAAGAAYLRGFSAGAAHVLKAVDAVTPFPFKANASDRDDIEGPFCNNGIEDDATIEKVERIVGHYLLAVKSEAQVATYGADAPSVTGRTPAS